MGIAQGEVVCSLKVLCQLQLQFSDFISSDKPSPTQDFQQGLKEIV